MGAAYRARSERSYICASARQLVVKDVNAPGGRAVDGVGGTLQDQAVHPTVPGFSVNRKIAWKIASRPRFDPVPR